MFALHLLSEEGPNASLSWLVWVVLAVFFLMVIIGWLVSRNNKDAPASDHGQDASHGGHDAHAG